MMPLIFVSLCLILDLAFGQSFNSAFLKYDYCIRGSTSCSGNLCGNAPGWCVGDSFLAANTCGYSGLGVDQPAHDPAVVSSIQCVGNNANLRHNYSTLADCQANTNEIGTGTIFDSIGYANFCWGGLVNHSLNPFPQYDMNLGYYTHTFISCPSGNVTGITFIEDPAPHVCVADHQECPDSTTQTFIKSVDCYSDGPETGGSQPVESSGDLTGGQKAGIAIGVILGVALLAGAAVAIYLFVLKPKDERF